MIWSASRAAGYPSNTPPPSEGQMRPVIPGYPSNNYGLPPMNPTGLAVQSGSLEDRMIQCDPRELWFLSLPQKLTPQQCLNILRAGLGGDVWQMWQLLSLMLDSWHTFRMASHQLREAVSYTKFNFMPYAEEGKEPSGEAQDKAGVVTMGLKGMSPDQFTDEKGASGMIYDYCDAALAGLELTELMWQKVGKGKKGLWLPRAAAWVHPRHYTFTNIGVISVYSDEYGQMFPDTKLSSSLRVVNRAPDPDKFICSQFISRSGSCLGAGFMRPLVWYWAARQFNQEWMLNTAKQYGTPFIDITYRPGDSSEDERQRIMDFTKNAGPERRLVHPEGTVATIHPAQTLGTDNPQRYLTEESDKACLFLLLGQSATTMSTPGKLGEEGTHADVKDERVMGLANWLARTTLRHFARAICRVNFGDDLEAPNIEPDFTKPLTSAQVAQLAQALAMSRTIVRADEFYKKIGFTLPQAGDVIMEGGKMVIFSEPITQDEQQRIQQEAAMFEQAMGSQPGANQGQVEATVRHYKDIRTILAKATKAELDELEGLVVKAQEAGGNNGEWKAVEIKVADLSRRRVEL